MGVVVALVTGITVLILHQQSELCYAQDKKHTSKFSSSMLHLVAQRHPIQYQAMIIQIILSLILPIFQLPLYFYFPTEFDG